MQIQSLSSNSGQTNYRFIDFETDHILFYCAGHCNDLNSHKGLALEQICIENRISMVHWAYHGWGGSVGTTTPIDAEGYIQDWLLQSFEIFDHFKDQQKNAQFITVGYSMGAMLALTLSKARQDHVKGLILLASGFGPELIDMAKDIYQTYDVILPQNCDETINGIEFKKSIGNELLFKNELNFSKAIFINHAKDDHLVPYKNAENLYNALPKNTPKSIKIDEIGAHRLNEPNQLAWLKASILKIVND